MTEITKDDAICFMTWKEIKERTGLGRSTIYRMMKDGEFPRPVKLYKRRVAWSVAAFNIWAQGKIDAQAVVGMK